MRPHLFLFLVMMLALAGGESALARGSAHAAHGAPPSSHAHHPAPRHKPPAPQGWAKVGKHVYTSATWHGGRRGAWATDVPF